MTPHCLGSKSNKDCLHHILQIKWDCEVCAQCFQHTCLCSPDERLLGRELTFTEQTCKFCPVCVLSIFLDNILNVIITLASTTVCCDQPTSTSWTVLFMTHSIYDDNCTQIHTLSESFCNMASQMINQKSAQKIWTLLSAAVGTTNCQHGAEACSVTKLYQICTKLADSIFLRFYLTHLYTYTAGWPKFQRLHTHFKFTSISRM